MTEKNPDNPFPESDDNPSFEDVSSQDENEVTVILPEELTEEVGGDVTEEVTEDVPDHTESENEQPGEVFVLLPDGDDQIPIVETQELADVTEDVDAPRLTSVYESTTASQVGLRTDNPAHEDAAGDDTEIDSSGEPTEDSVATEHPTETMSSGDLDDFANEVADDMLVEGESSVSQNPIAYDDEGVYDQDEPDYEEEEMYAPSGERSSSFKKVVLSLAALIAIGAIGVFYFPGYVGLDSSFDIGEFVMGHVNSLFGGTEVASSGDPLTPPDGGGTDVPDGGGALRPLAMATQETFKSKFRQAIELGFGEIPR